MKNNEYEYALELLKESFPKVPQHALIEILNKSINGASEDEIFDYLFEEGYAEPVKKEYQVYVELKRLSPQDTAKLVITIQNIVKNLNSNFSLQNKEINHFRQLQNEMFTELIKQYAELYKLNNKQIKQLESKWFKSKSTKLLIANLKEQNSQLKSTSYTLMRLKKGLKLIEQATIKESSETRAIQ